MNKQKLIDDIVQEGSVLNLKKEDVDVIFTALGTNYSATVTIEDDTFYFMERPFFHLLSWIRWFMQLFFCDPAIRQYATMKRMLMEVGVDVSNDLLYQYEGSGKNSICKMILRRPGINFCTVESNSMPSRIQAWVDAVSRICQWLFGTTEHSEWN